MKISMISLGCDKNLVDSEMMLGMLEESGYELTSAVEEAEIVVVNTCCFINDAKEESINTLIELGERKKEGTLKYIIATGCLAQRYQEEIKSDIPEVDVILGTNAIDKVMNAIIDLSQNSPRDYMVDINAVPVYGKKRILSTGGFFAYLKIAEGCNKNCSYCIIPKVRGKYRSVPMDVLLKEATELASQGVKELILVAQETTLYGIDLYGHKSLPELLTKLAEISGLEWIRVMYCYPEEINEEFIEVMKKEPKICHYLDLPIQHANDEILKRMGRRTSKAELIEKIKFLRSEIPDICLRTTLITGFPGETIEQHEELKQFVSDMKFDRLGVFTYSPEEDTKAALFEEQIDEAVKELRQAELMELQQENAFQKAKEMIGKEVSVFVEGKVQDENVYVGRTYKDAPNVDGLIFINSEEELMSGQILQVEVTGSYEYDLIGDIL